MIAVQDTDQKIYDWISFDQEIQNQISQEQSNQFNLFDIALLKDSGWYQIKDIQYKEKQWIGKGCEVQNHDKQILFYLKVMKMSNIKCHSTCKTCFGESETECLSCSENSKLLNQECFDICPQGQEWDYEFSQCQFSSPKYSKNQCSYCIQGQFCYKGQCLDSCEEGFSTKVVNNLVVCEKCSQHCLSCLSNNVCIKCTKNLQVQTGQCVNECESGYYSNNQNYCQKCHPTCSSCKGRQFNQCISCPTESELVFGECRKIDKDKDIDNFTNKQVKQQDINQNDSQKKQSVDKSRGRGRGAPSNRHRSSRTPARIHKPHTSNRGRHSSHEEDKKICLQGYFPLFISGKHSCLRCMMGCIICKQLQRCEKCELGYIKKDGVCKKKSEKIISNENQSLKKCHNSCQSCYGPHKDECLSCEKNMQLEGGKCIFKN